jgi:type IV pilus assembly protein PilV
MSDAMLNSRKYRSAGFTLVETMVAMVVMSVGMLGIAALYVEGLKAGRTSIYRTEAVSLASDLADRIRANPTAVAAYAGAGANNNCVAGGVDCAPAQLAQDDLFRWRQDVVARLPAGAANIVVAAGAPTNTYTITVTWTEAGVAAPLSYVVTMQI